MMITLLIFLLTIPIAIFLILLLFRVRSKKYLYGIPILVFSFPFILGIGIYLLRAPIQQGKILPNLGPTLNLIFPAEDLFIPLAGKTLSADVKKYQLNPSHKYVGKHAVYIETDAADRKKMSIEKRLSMMVHIQDGEKVIYSITGERGYPFRGNNKYGFYYAGYHVPQDVPVSKSLKFTVTITKGLEDFLETHKNAKIIVRKSSDL